MHHDVMYLLPLTSITPLSIGKVVLCFSPVGFTLRTRARKFPALVNCTAIDWFHSWPQLALQSVSSSFIEKIPALEVTLHSIPSHLQPAPSTHCYSIFYLIFHFVLLSK